MTVATPRPLRFVRPGPPPLAKDCALFLDIDGTLADFSPTPDEVAIDREIAPALQRISGELDGALAIITGRSISSADRLFAGMTLAMAGQHGAERRDADGTIHLHAPRKDTLAKLRKMFRRLAKRHPDLLLEDKGATIALHYRRMPELASHVYQELRKSIEEEPGYELQPGKMLLEVRPEGRDKGTAIHDFMAENPFAGRLPVFVGDDRTDEHGFDFVERLGGWSVKVGPGRTAARFRLADTAAVKRWLLAPVLPAPAIELEPTDPE
jgi:trehalose 6-phosphate phosphatase